MSTQAYIRGGALVLILGAALILGVAGAFADSIRSRVVFRPREQRTEQAVQQLADRERSLHATNGNFSAFSNSDVEKNASLLGLPWSTYPLNEYYFDAVALESGNIRLRALPRPQPVLSLSIRARLYIVELSPGGEAVRSGWYPSAD